MEDYDKLKSIILVAKEARFQNRLNSKYCLRCGDRSEHDEPTGTYVCTLCSHIYDEKAEKALLRFSEVLATLKDIDPDQGKWGEFWAYDESGQRSYVVASWDFEANTLDKQPDNVKQFLIDLLVK